MFPKYLRTGLRSELYRDYKALVEESGQEFLSEKDFIKFLSDVAKQDPKALSALDLGAVRGKEAIGRLIKEQFLSLPNCYPRVSKVVT